MPIVHGRARRSPARRGRARRSPVRREVERPPTACISSSGSKPDRPPSPPNLLVSRVSSHLRDWVRSRSPPPPGGGRNKPRNPPSFWSKQRATPKPLPQRCLGVTRHQRPPQRADAAQHCRRGALAPAAARKAARATYWQPSEPKRTALSTHPPASGFAPPRVSGPSCMSASRKAPSAASSIAVRLVRAAVRATRRWIMYIIAGVYQSLASATARALSRACSDSQSGGTGVVAQRSAASEGG